MVPNAAAPFTLAVALTPVLPAETQVNVAVLPEVDERAAILGLLDDHDTPVLEVPVTVAVKLTL